jgi:hypothetical protein
MVCSGTALLFRFGFRGVTGKRLSNTDTFKYWSLSVRVLSRAVLNVSDKEHYCEKMERINKIYADYIKKTVRKVKNGRQKPG